MSLARIAVFFCCALAHAQGAQLVRDALATDLVSAGEVEYAVLLPDGYDPDGDRLPLLLLLHGSGGDREQLVRFQPQIEDLWESNLLPSMVVTMPSVASGSIYMDSYDGRNRWESFVMDEFLPHIRKHYRASVVRETTMVSGTSMGGFGGLRLAFKHPETFGAVAAMEPGAWPGLTWGEVPDRNKIRAPESIAALFGETFDEQRFREENPASILDRDPSRLASTAIYLEVGDEDGLGFVEGVEYMHRLLWRHGLRHEFRLVRWADHVGSTVMDRSRDRFLFLARYLAQPTPAEATVEAFRERMAESHKRRGMEPFGFWPNSTLRDYNSGNPAVDAQRALKDSEELRRRRGVIRFADVAYDDKPGVDPQRQRLDIYVREGITGAPVILYVHGGSWVRGDKRRALFKPSGLVPAGYLFASMNYRFRPHASLSDLAQDVANAAVWLERHAPKYGGDGHQLFLLGHSAGAHLVAAVGTNARFMEAAGASLEGLSGVIPIDTAMYDIGLQMENPAPAHRNAFGSDPQDWLPVSPWQHVEQGKGIPPFLFFVSDGRPTMESQVLPMVRALRASGVEATAFEAKGRTHSSLDTYLGVSGDPSTELLLDFLSLNSQRRASPDKF